MEDKRLKSALYNIMRRTGPVYRWPLIKNSCPNLRLAFFRSWEFVRLCAASAVLLGHSYSLSEIGARDPHTQLSAEHTNLEKLALYVFFAISGYFITQSWMRDPSLSRFALRRSLRIFPGLIFVIVSSVLIIGPLMTKLPLGIYFISGDTWMYLTKIFIYPTQYGLPGVYENNPLSGVVNGVLWSLRLELALYGMVAVLGLLTLLRWRLTGFALLLICLAMDTLLWLPSLSVKIPFFHQIIILCLNATFFLIGMSMAQAKAQEKAPVRHPVNKFNDYSYGVYLWSFPVQQGVIRFYPHIMTTQLFVTALPIIAVLAALSWHLVEKRALSFKPYRK